MPKESAERFLCFQALKREALSSDKWKSKLFFTLRDAGPVVELEVRMHKRKTGLTTQAVRLKTPPAHPESPGSGTMFCASVDLPGNFEPGGSSGTFPTASCM